MKPRLQEVGEEAVTQLKLEALSGLHERKVAALMKSIAALRDEVARMKAESKEHRRSELIRSLRDKLREQELAVDVLKEAYVEASGSSDAQANELVILRTLGGPKRFRPKSREELQNELAAAERRIEATTKRQEAKAPVEEKQPETAEDDDPTPRLVRDGSGAEELPSAAHLRELAAVANKLEAAEVKIARYEYELAESSRLVAKLRSDKALVEAEADRFEQQAANAAELQRQLDVCRAARDAAELKAARKDGEAEVLSLELEHERATKAANVEALKHDMSVLQDELSAAVAAERELRAAALVERERAGRAVKGEVAAQRIADGQVKNAERRLRDAVQARKELQARYEAREAEVRVESEAKAEARRRDDATRATTIRRDRHEQQRLVDAERARSGVAEAAAGAARERSEVLQSQVDTLRLELQASAEARADDRAEADAYARAMAERVAALQAALEEERSRRKVDAASAEADVAKVAVRTARDRAKAHRMEELHAREHTRRERAEAGEAGHAATAAAALKRQANLQDHNRVLQRRIDELEQNLEALERHNREQRAQNDVLRATQTRDDEDDDRELNATRKALVAHMRLADVYSRVHDATEGRAELSAQAASHNHASLERARAELERALAMSPHLDRFYAHMLAHIEDDALVTVEVPRAHEAQNPESPGPPLDLPAPLDDVPQRALAHPGMLSLSCDRRRVDLTAAPTVDDRFENDDDGCKYDVIAVDDSIAASSSSHVPPPVRAHNTITQLLRRRSRIVAPRRRQRGPLLKSKLTRRRWRHRKNSLSSIKRVRRDGRFHRPRRLQANKTKSYATSSEGEQYRSRRRLWSCRCARRHANEEWHHRRRDNEPGARQRRRRPHCS